MSAKLIEQIVKSRGKRRKLDRNRYLFHQGDPVKTLYVGEEGLIELTRHQSDGSAIVLQRAGNLTVLAEASAYAEIYHCDAIVQLPSIVFQLPMKIFLERIRTDEGFSTFWTSHLAREVQSARYRSEILSRNTVADRLDGWLAWKGNGLPAKGQWKAVAGQIGVSPEALYRELASRRTK
mgnify:FL=1